MISFHLLLVADDRKMISKGGFLTEKEAKKAGLEAWKRYCLCGLPERSSDISFADFLDDWMENDCKYKPLLHISAVSPSPSALATAATMMKAGSMAATKMAS